ncbi:MAG: hypothetical protein GX456_14160 [Verrucomicrobia bacterium]|nr:hypothetical protein [Verrucomicrobiota bacterium]
MNTRTKVTIVTGPAGSGKTHRCITEICNALESNPAGPPLVFIAPKQATFQLERQILAAHQIPGYTRLSIVSFERLAEYILSALGQAPCPVLSDQGKIMVLRAILHQNAPSLRLFHPTARLPGFALELSETLRELQQHGLSPKQLRSIAEGLTDQPRLRNKLEDIAMLFGAYMDWLEDHHLHDVGSLLDLATNALRVSSKTINTPTNWKPRWAGLWLDGFAELSPQEIELLATLLPLCERATLAFCAESACAEVPTWNSTWCIVGRTVRTLMSRLDQTPNISLTTETLPRQSNVGRFSASPELALLEMSWESGDRIRPKLEPMPPTIPTAKSKAITHRPGQSELSERHQPSGPIKIIRCSTPQFEATVAAREILHHVREHGGRFRDAAVLVRSLTTHADVIRRVFAHYQIPFFLDRRESVSHHPLVELTRSALRTIAFGWQHQDWMSVLKTELLPANDESIDRLENEALARGWDQTRWLSSMTASDRESPDQLQHLIAAIAKPFRNLTAALESDENKPSGQSLARAIRRFWAELKVDKRLAEWSNEPAPASIGTVPPAQLHSTVWEQLNSLLEEVELAFANNRLDLREWVAVLEAGFQSLTVGLIPPALDQVLVGAVDRSRNPNLDLVIVLGMNASIFPTMPAKPGILSETDRSVLASHGFDLTANERIHLAREKFLGYIALTRSSNRLVLTYAERDAGDRPLTPSPFISSLRRMFPRIEVELFCPDTCQTTAIHPHELVPRLIKVMPKLPHDRIQDSLAKQFRALQIAKETVSVPPLTQNAITPAVAEKLYGPKKLRCSVSELEQFAACPFQFFVSAGLRAQEREILELDARNVGTFLHEVLAEFHRRLSAARYRWRDVEPQQARQLVADIASATIQSYARDLFRSSQDRSLTAPALVGILEDFVEQCVAWMRTGYQFDPCAVETAFGTTGAPLPAWEIPIDSERSIALRGKIDRVDICRDPHTTAAWCVVVDYKLSENRFNDTHVANGLQLQLPAYLAAIANLAPGTLLENGTECIPCGMFYAPLRGAESSADSRAEAVADPVANRAKAHIHRGRFRSDALAQLDRLHDQENCTGQFLASRRGKSPRKYTDAVPPDVFQNMLASVKTMIRDFGKRILSGDVSVDPCATGASDVACDSCAYAPICRINRSKHLYRQLAPS